MKTTCIVGAGTAGLIVLLLLQEAGADISKVTIIDPFFDGGDLTRKWTSVLSNTPWSKTINALKQNCVSLSILSSIDPTSNTPLVEIGHLIRDLAEGALAKANKIQGSVSSVNYVSEAKEWSINVTVEHSGQTIRAKQLILSQGAEPKTINLAIPSIPLEVALDSQRLKHYVKPNESVLVFGTAHSGTLVIRNLADAGASVTAYYKSKEPFYWDRNGDYDGIKGEAATIADDIISRKISVTLVSLSDTATLIRTSRTARWVVYAMGLEPRKINLTIDGNERSSREYNDKTGKLGDLPAWGFGIAYPNRAPDGIHLDVGVAPFLDHIKTQIPDIISDNN
jgi:cation diffusion facilitator CzcD-associated flavoprotein CzcO